MCPVKPDPSKPNTRRVWRVTNWPETFGNSSTFNAYPIEGHRADAEATKNRKTSYLWFAEAIDASWAFSQVGW